MTQHPSRRRVLAALAGVTGGLAGCLCLGAVDCRVDVRFLEISPEPLNRANATSPPGGDDAPTGTDTPRTPTPADYRPNSAGKDRWLPPSEEPWKLKLILSAEYVRTDRGTFDDVSVVVYDDDRQEIGSVDIGAVIVDNGFERQYKKMDAGCCPGGVLERFYGRTETVAVERFPRHIVAAAGDCRGGDRLSVSTFEEGGYYDRRYGCGETPWIFDD